MAQIPTEHWKNFSLFQKTQTTLQDLKNRSLFEKRSLADRALKEDWYISHVLELAGEEQRDNLKLSLREARQRVFLKFPSLERAYTASNAFDRTWAAVEYEQARKGCGPKQAFSIVATRIPATVQLARSKRFSIESYCERRGEVLR